LFVCAGDFVPEFGRYQEWLIAKKVSLGLDNVVFPGWQSEPHAIYRAADIAVMPSVVREDLRIGNEVMLVRGTEGFPRSILDAMNAGLPVVASEVAGVREQIDDGVMGFIVPPADQERMAQRIGELLENPELRKRMGNAARTKVLNKFSSEKA